MISHPGLRRLEPPVVRPWPRLFSHWQLLSLVPGIVPRLVAGGRALELEVGGGALLSSLARSYPASLFIGLTSLGRWSAMGDGQVKFSAPNLHFKTVESLDLSRFRQVDLVLALAGMEQRATIRAVAQSMVPGGYFVLREPEVTAPVPPPSDRRFGTLYLPGVNSSWISPSALSRVVTNRLLETTFGSVHSVKLSEDPGYLYYIARAGSEQGEK